MSGATGDAARVGGVPRPGTGVLARPVTGTPELNPNDDRPVEEIRQLAHCGKKMYAVGTFAQILQRGRKYTRSNVFSFQATKPYTVTTWAPKVNGEVNSIAFRKGRCEKAFIGGQFTSVNGTRAVNIAELSTTTGAVVKRFRHHAADEVESLLWIPHHLLVGGFFKSINHSSADPYMTSLNPRSGKNDGFVHLRIKGEYAYPGVAGNRTRVFSQELSHNGKFDLVMGDFTSVARHPRQQIFMIDVAGHFARLTRWRSPEFDGHCVRDEPFYIRGASWSPDDSTIYTASTGYHPYHQPTGTYPRSGLCDAAAAFPATHASVRDKWINYTGCDSLYATAADASTAYFAGHDRWSMNSYGCNREGKGAYPAEGLEGLAPSTGALYLNRSRRKGYYSRSRGDGADDMLITKAGLWIASDNADGSQTCGGVNGLSGICFLPYPRHR